MKKNGHSLYIITSIAYIYSEMETISIKDGNRLCPKGFRTAGWKVEEAETPF